MLRSGWRHQNRLLFDHWGVENERSGILLVSIVLDLQSHATHISPRITVSHTSIGNAKYTSKTTFGVDYKPLIEN